MSKWRPGPEGLINKNKARFVIEEAGKWGFHIYDMEAFYTPQEVEPLVSQPEIWIGITVRDRQCLDVLCGKDGDVVFLVMDYHTRGGKPEKTRCYLGKHADTIRECFDDCLKSLDCYWRHRLIDTIMDFYEPAAAGGAKRND